MRARSSIWPRHPHEYAVSLRPCPCGLTTANGPNAGSPPQSFALPCAVPPRPWGEITSGIGGCFLVPYHFGKHQHRLPPRAVPGPVGDRDAPDESDVALEQILVADLEADELAEQRVGAGQLACARGLRSRGRVHARGPARQRREARRCPPQPAPDVSKLVPVTPSSSSCCLDGILAASAVASADTRRLLRQTTSADAPGGSCPREACGHE